MTYPRAHLVDLFNGGYYHCISRCVRRGWLCGEDSVTGKSYEHRKHWAESRILHLATCFSVELYGYAVMSNHYHLVLEVLPAQARAWADDEIAHRWLQISAKDPENIDEKKLAVLLANQDRIAELRKRLGDLSWFMRYLNEWLARKANQEDGCTGRFWEGRFKSFALLDESAVLASTAYVDLNPVRARITDNVACAPYTSVARRLSEMEEHAPKLAPLRNIGIELPEYLELLRWTASTTRDNAKTPHQPACKALENLDTSTREWHTRVKANRFKFRAYGAKDKLKSYAEKLGQRWIKSSAAS